MRSSGRMFKDNREKYHRRYYQLGGLTIQLEADLPITSATFQPKFKFFAEDRPGEDTITISHHFFLPNLNGWNIGEVLYRKAPWVVYRDGPSWIYMGISGQWVGAITDLWFRIWYRLCPFRAASPRNEQPAIHAPLFLAKVKQVHLLALANHEHTKVRIYHKSEKPFRRGNLYSLTLFPTDQVVLAQVLARREACYIHASGVILDGRGLLFVGHAEAGKTTMATMLKEEAEILCDDRMIVRRWRDGFKIHGTWSHGDVSDVSASSAPLKAILFLEQAQENRVIRIDDRQEAIRRLLACLIKPLVTADWWDQMLTLVDRIAHEVPCYRLRFDKSGAAVSLLKDL
jgi:hypothetical protein